MPELCLGDLAAHPALTISETSPLSEAEKLLARSTLKALVVVDQAQNFSGLLERRVLEKALAYGLEKKVGELADPEAPALEREALATTETLTKAFCSPCSLAVILEGQRPWGVLTPRDLYASGLALPSGPRLALDVLPQELKDLLSEIRTLAHALGTRVFLVGGAVRDLLWQKEVFDLDLVATAQVEDLAQAICARFKGKIKARSPFGTFKLSLPQGLVLDLAQSRWEYYQAPAELPRVSPGPLYLDLWRRDFTINALALTLNGPRTGEIINWLGGVGDMELRRLRVHHPLSFVDDPTRIFRAARYLTRFDLRPGACFLRAWQLAKEEGTLALLSPARIRGELERILAEKTPLKALEYLFSLGVFKELCGGEAQGMRQALRDLFKVAQDLPCTPKTLLKALVLLFSEVGPSWTRLYDFPPGEAEVLLQGLKQALREARLPHLRPSQRVKTLEKLPEPCLLALAAKDPMVRGVVHEYLLRLRNVRPALSGKDLKALGVPPGPEMGRILRRLREARLDGEVHSPEDEKALVKKEFAHVFS